MNISDCDAVILCGGLGTRLQSAVRDVPKVMAEMNGEPFLDYIIRHLKSQGIQRLVLCTGYKAQTVERYYRDKDFGLTIDFSREEKPLGTGGALKHAAEIITSNPFLVLNGDSYVEADLKAFLAFHLKKKATASILVAEQKNTEDFGSVMLDQNGRISCFEEKIQGSSNPKVNAGVYCFDQKIFTIMPAQEKFSLETDLFPALVKQPFFGHVINQEFLDIGTPQRYASVQKKLGKGSK